MDEEVLATKRRVLGEDGMLSLHLSLKAPTAEVVMSRSMYHLAKKITRLLQKRVHEVKRAVGYALAWEELIAAGE